MSGVLGDSFREFTHNIFLIASLQSDLIDIIYYMLEDKLPELIRLTYNIKIIVAATYKAKQSLAAKGLTPAIFLDRFYKQKSQGPHEVSYSFKQKQMRPLPQFVTIDLDDYALLRREDKDQSEDIDEEVLSKKIMECLSQQQLKYLRQTDKSIFNDRVKIQKFMNNQSFHWFQQCNKMYYHALTLGQENFRVNTSDQPMGICFVIEVEKERGAKQVFDKLKFQIDMLMRKVFQLNPQQQKNVSLMMIILFDVSQNCTVQQALQYTTYFKQSTNIQSSLIFRLAINGQDLHDSVQWSRFNRPILHFNYKLKSSDPVRIIAYEEFAKIQDIVSYHKETIRKNLQKKLDDLTKKHQQVNKATKIIASFFRGSAPNDKTYTKQELQLRQLADKMFILEDYKKAFQIYKSLASKMQKRNPSIQNNIAQMIQLCLAMSKFHNIRLKSDPYNEIEKYSDRIFKFYQNKSKLRLKRYLIFLVYVFHTFKTFDRQFIRSVFYLNLKGTFSTNPILNVVSILIYEQFANMNLLYANIDYRRYCYDLTRVASRFSEAKMHNYALRCFLVVEAIYRDTFSNIQKYQYTQLSHLFLQFRNFKQSLRCLKTSWEIYINRMESEDLQKNQQQLIKHIENYNKMIKEIENLAPNQLQQLMQPNLKIPIIHALNLQTKDQMLQFDQKSGMKWQDIGQIILDSKQLMSAGLNQREFRNMFKTFDFGVPQEKYLIHRFNSTNFAQAILKKNSRNAYVGQPIKLSFYMRNPLRGDIDIQNIQVKLKSSLPGVNIQTENRNATIKSFKSAQILFTLTPSQPGFLEVHKIQWIFMKLLTEYNIKQPQQIKSQIKSCYFKVNINPAVGCLQGKAYFEDYYYEGQKGKMKIKLTNIGSEKVTKFFVASGQDDMFPQKLAQINAQILPNQYKQFQFDISVPLVHSNIQSGEEKKICKLLILYKTGDRFRICRTINKFNILRIAKIQNIVCQRLSTHLHLLSFSKKKSNNKEDVNALEWMIIPGGYQIVKKQAADLASQTNYFFFIRKGNFSLAKFQFQNWAKDLSSYPQQFLKIQQPAEDVNALNIRFLWRKQNKTGYISKTNIPISINEHGYLSTTYPINFKINYQKQISHNFRKIPYLQIPISIKLKNVLYNDELKVTINFIDGVDSDSSWQGITERRLSLKMGSEAKINLKYVVVRPGIYNLSNEIKYIIINSKSQVVTITHSEYEQIYLTVKNEGAVATKSDFDEAFKQFYSVSEPKSTQIRVENQSLI